MKVKDAGRMPVLPLFTPLVTRQMPPCDELPVERITCNDWKTAAD